MLTKERQMDCTKCTEIEARIDKRLEKLERGHELQSMEIEALKLSNTSSSEQLKTIFKTLDEIKGLIREQTENQKETLKIYNDIMDKNYSDVKTELGLMRKEIDTVKNKDDKILAEKVKKLTSIFITVLVTALSSGAVAVIFHIIKGYI